jgi:DNA mismatch repair protein MutS2
MLTIGSDVLVRSLKRRGVVVEMMKAGVYRVQIGAMTITAGENDLEAPAPSRKKKGRQTAASAAVERDERPAGSSSEPASIDLHGLTVDEARNRVAGYISRAILAGLERVEIIHGIGSGKLKAAVTKDLRALPVVRSVKPHPTNPGITLAYL